MPELGSIGLLRFAWRQLTSMRTALILLMLLGVAAIPGSLIPQRTQDPMAVTAYFKSSPSVAKWLDQLSLFDVYGSPWFSAIYILLFISLIGCVLPRTVEHFHAARALPPATPKNLNRMEFYNSWPAIGGELDAARTWFAKNHFRVIEKDGSISAEKGYSRETGNLFFHLALILILLGISLSSLFGMRGEAILNVGERFVNTPTSYDSLAYGKLFKDGKLPNFIIKVDRFDAQYNVETNAPEDYTLNITLYQGDLTKGVKRVIKVNSPLTIGNTKIYLQANGYSPVVTVRDSKGNVGLQGPIPFLPQDGNLRSIGAIKVPDADPQVGFVGSFVPTYARSEGNGAISVFPQALDPRLLLSAWSGDLGLDSGTPQSVYRIDTSAMKQIGLKSLKSGESFNYPGGSLTFEGYVQWVNLQIVEDSGKNYALLGAIVSILGLLASLFTRRRRIWIRVGKDVEVAGLAKNAAPGLEEELVEFMHVVKGEK
ncbi:MAG: cytochrome c biogenesis protein ResB [Actinobacteria bacterium]|nr:cytochrome c biogenesis protein ResB [Actinomycetota bacterium]